MTADRNTKSVPRCLIRQLSSLINASTASAEVKARKVLGFFSGCALSGEFCTVGKRKAELELAASVTTGGFATVVALGAGAGASGDSILLVLKGGWLTVTKESVAFESTQGLGAP